VEWPVFWLRLKIVKASNLKRQVVVGRGRCKPRKCGPALARSSLNRISDYAFFKNTLLHCARFPNNYIALAARPYIKMDDTTALQECVDLSLEMDELSPATQMFLSSSPSLQSHKWDNVTPTLASSIESEQPPFQPLPPATRRPTNPPAASRPTASSAAQLIKSASKGNLAKRSVLDRGKSASKAKSPSGPTPNAKSLALARAAEEHRDSAEFFERSNGGLLSPPYAFAASNFPLLPVEDAAPSVPSAVSAPVFTPQKIIAKTPGRDSKLLRPSPNVSLFSGSKRKDRTDAAADAASAPPLQSSVESNATRTLDLATALQIGPGKPVPAPPVPPYQVQQQLPGLSTAPSSDVDFLHIQQFLASRCHHVVMSCSST